jgi:hypothetical protein
MYITQLVLDLKQGTVSDTRPDRQAFATEIMNRNPVAIFHSSNICTATSGAVMWMSGRMDVFTQPQEIVDLANAALEWQVRHLVDSIPVS